MTAPARPYSARARRWPFGGREETLTLVDLGAQKVACVIVSISSRGDPERSIRVLASGMVRSSGISAGRIVNLAGAEAALRRAVAKAEAEAGFTVEDLIVTAPFPGLMAETFDARTAGGAGAFADPGLAEIAAAAEDHCSARQRTLLHLFSSQHERNWNDFVGSVAEGGAATEVSTVSIPSRSYRQVAACVRKSLLVPKDLIAAPIAASLAVTDAEERQKGVLVLDIGAHTAGCAIFADGIPVFAEVIPEGGQALTDHLANAFALRPFEAERLKIRYGSVFDGLQTDKDLPFAHGESGEPISRLSVNNLIRIRTSALLKAVNERLKAAGYSRIGVNVVLTGGTSMLPGIAELASRLMIAEVRVGRTRPLARYTANNTLSALVGACLYVCRHHSTTEMAGAPRSMPQDSSYVSRISQWLRASF